jgi:hypothetical protein
MGHESRPNGHAPGVARLEDEESHAHRIAIHDTMYLHRESLQRLGHLQPFSNLASGTVDLQHDSLGSWSQSPDGIQLEEKLSFAALVNFTIELDPGYAIYDLDLGWTRGYCRDAADNFCRSWVDLTPCLWSLHCFVVHRRTTDQQEQGGDQVSDSMLEDSHDTY